MATVRAWTSPSAFSKLCGLLCALFLMACEPAPAPDIPAEASGRNVIVIVIDSLRPDHLGYGGYSRATSPFMDRIAAQSVTFDQAFANSSFTQQSVATLMSGLLPSRTGSTGWGVPPFKSSMTLGEIYARAGYRTAFFSNTLVLEDPLFSQGFEKVEILGNKWDYNGGGLQLSKTAAEFAKAQRDERFLMYLHYLDPHAPYRPPKEVHSLFVDEIYPHPMELYPYVRDHVHELVKTGFGPGDPRFEDLVTRYDAEIALVDRAIETLFKDLDAAGLLEESILVITSDHGEEFLDHQFVDHAWTLYNESLRVPLLIWTPEIHPSRTDQRVDLADLLPTLMELSEISYDPEAFDGKSLFQSSDSGFHLDPQPKAHVAEVLIANRNTLRSITVGRWKYIAAWKWHSPEERAAALVAENVPATDIWGPVAHEELYDLEADPGETMDVSADHPEVVSRFRSHLENYLASCSKEEGRAPTEFNPEQESALKSLGYL